MQIFSSFFFISYLTLCSHRFLAAGSHDVVVNDDNPEIVFVGTWTYVKDNSSSYMDDHHWTQTSGSHAIFNFTGQFRREHLVNSSTSVS